MCELWYSANNIVTYLLNVRTRVTWNKCFCLYIYENQPDDKYKVMIMDVYAMDIFILIIQKESTMWTAK